MLLWGNEGGSGEEGADWMGWDRWEGWSLLLIATACEKQVVLVVAGYGADIPRKVLRYTSVVGAKHEQQESQVSPNPLAAVSCVKGNQCTCYAQRSTATMQKDEQDSSAATARILDGEKPLE